MARLRQAAANGSDWLHSQVSAMLGGEASHAGGEGEPSARARRSRPPARYSPGSEHGAGRLARSPRGEQSTPPAKRSHTVDSVWPGRVTRRSHGAVGGATGQYGAASPHASTAWRVPNSPSAALHECERVDRRGRTAPRAATSGVAWIERHRGWAELTGRGGRVPRWRWKQCPGWPGSWKFRAAGSSSDSSHSAGLTPAWASGLQEGFSWGATSDASPSARGTTRRWGVGGGGGATAAGTSEGEQHGGCWEDSWSAR